MSVPTKQPFEWQIQISPQDIDALGHVNNVVYLRWVQEVAEAHWNVLASPELQKELAWVVLRHEINYHRPAFLEDKSALSVEFKRYRERRMSFQEK